ncbi:MAG TPA: hypothetical protein VE890_03630 [Thermoguttaceae bacterium]|nr:hypothetical protein [Thermoguttaceae bacterium]
MIQAAMDLKMATAFHEAGHAVLLHASGHQIEGIHLVHSVNGWEGIVIFDKGSAIADDTMVKMLLAGPLAECRFWGASAYAKKNGGQAEQLTESIAFDPDDKMCRLTNELLAAEDADESCCTVRVSFINPCGRPYCCEIPLDGLDGDFWDADKKAKASDKTSDITTHEAVIEVRGILSETATWARVMRLAARVLQEPKQDVTVGELLKLGKLDRLLESLRGQPRRPVQHVVLSGDQVHAVLDDSP